MSVLARGMGPMQAVLTRGMGQVIPQTAHPELFNTPTVNPRDLGQSMGTEGDPNYAVWRPHPHAQYNARSVTIYLPEGAAFSPRSISRLQGLLRILKPMTCSIRMREVNGRTYFELHDLAEDTAI